MNRRDAALRYHEQTKHSWQSVRSGGHYLDWANKPVPFKHHPTLPPLALPVEFAESNVPALDVLSGTRVEPARPLDLAGLARLLFFSAGVVRLARAPGGVLFFRAAPSAGALYPVEVYAVCGDLPGLEAGTYHFNPVDFAVRRLRAGDVRAVLADAAAEPMVVTAPATLVFTGIPWRTTWKYRERGYRHLFWDCGTILANLLAAAEAVALPARVLMGFVDTAVSQLLGLGEPEEFPLALAPVGHPQPLPGEPARAAPVDIPVHPLSPRPAAYPLITETHRAGDLHAPEDVAAWRDRADVRAAGSTTTVNRPARPDSDTIEAVILRRGSTRRFARRPIPREGLEWALAAATRQAPLDAVPPGRTLLDVLLTVHDVDGVDPGGYRWEEGELRSVRRGVRREDAAHLCLDQGLGGDSAYTVFFSCPLERVLEALGSRGYRAAQFEAGLAAGRLHLAAYALGLGATGLTFYDDEVSEFFATDAAPMLVTAVGVPAYRARPGRRPSEMPRLRIQ